MKLAEVLALRKTLSDRLKELTGLSMFSQPIAQRLLVRVKMTETPADKLKSETKLLPAMAFLAERHFVTSRLTKLDGLIHTANTYTMVQVPANVGFEYSATGLSAIKGPISVDSALSLRSFAESMVTYLKSLLDGYIASPVIKSDIIQAQPESLNQVSTTLSTFDQDDVRRVLNFFSQQLRVLDTAIQEVNWTTEVAVDAEMTASFDQAEYMAATEARPTVAPGAVIPALNPR